MRTAGQHFRETEDLHCLSSSGMAGEPGHGEASHLDDCRPAGAYAAIDDASEYLIFINGLGREVCETLCCYRTGCTEQKCRANKRSR
jgi:hypothetical protein